MLEPGVVERLERNEALTGKVALNAQTAKAKAGDAIARQDELERSVVGALGISVRKVA